MQIPPILRSTSKICLLAAIGLCPAGCVSLDTTADFDEAMRLVEERSGWRPDWSTPWSDELATWDGTSPLTIDQAVTIALQSNRTMRATLEGIASARADLVQSGLLPNPVLSATFDTSIGGEGGPAAISISLVQQLTDLWLRPARQDAAAAALREQILGVSDEALRLVADVRQSHTSLVYGQRSIALTESHIELIDRAIEISESRIRAGEGTQLDVNRLQQLKLSLKAFYSQQVLEIGKARRHMLELLGRADAEAEWEAADVSTHRLSDAYDFSESEVIEMVSWQRLDVAAAHKMLETRLHELRVANLGSIPELEAGPSLERDEERRDALGAEISLEIPIFDTNQARVAKARSDWRRAQAMADQVLQSAVAQSRTAWLDVKANLELINFFRNQVLIVAKDNLRLAELAFQAGQIDMTVVLETQRELIQAEFELNELESIATDRMIELEYAVGGKLTRTTDAQLSEEDSESS